MVKRLATKPEAIANITDLRQYKINHYAVTAGVVYCNVKNELCTKTQYFFGGTVLVAKYSYNRLLLVVPFF